MRQLVRRVALRYRPPAHVKAKTFMRGSGAALASVGVVSGLAPAFFEVAQHAMMIMTFMIIYSWLEDVTADHVAQIPAKLRQWRADP